MSDHKFAWMRTSLLAVCLGLYLSSVTEAGYTTTVAGTDMPWLSVNGGLNTNYQYGVGDGAAPTVVGASSGISFAPGGTIAITYVSGLVSAGPGFPSTDANGDQSFITNANTGNSGHVFPSFYFNHASYPTYLDELVGTFTNSSGAIVGTPFAVGDNASVIIPTGATQLQLGINDDILSDNSGSFTVNINGPAAVPEPCSLVLVGLGSILAICLGRRRVSNS